MGGDRDRDLEYAYKPPQATLDSAVIVTSSKEKEIKKVEKKLRDIDMLEKKQAEGKELDKLQLKKLGEKESVMAELERLLQK